MKQISLASLFGDRIISVLAALLVLTVLAVTFMSQTDAAAPDNGIFYRVNNTPEMPEGRSNAVSFKPDSDYLVAVAENADNDTILVIDTETFQVVRTVMLEAGNLTTARFSPDGTMLAIGGDQVIVYDTSSADPSGWGIAYSANEDGLVTTLGFSPDGTYLAIGYTDDRDERLQVIDIEADWTPVTTNEDEPLNFEFGSYLTDLTFSPDGAYIVVGSEATGQEYVDDHYEYSGNLSVISVGDWVKVEGVPQLDSYDALSVAFSPDGNHLIVSPEYSGDGSSLYVYDTSASDPADWTIERRFDPNSVTSAWGLAFSPDGDTLAISYQNSPYFGVVDTSSENVADWEGIDTSDGVGNLDGGKGGNEGQGVAYSSDGTLIAVAMSGGAGLAIIRTTEGLASFDGGDGSAEEPYEISTCEQLQNMDAGLDAHYVLTGDVDCSMTNPEDSDFDPDGRWRSEHGFNPIGRASGTVSEFSFSNFTGSLDGQGHTVTGLFIDRTDYDTSGFYVGLFSTIGNGGSVSNLGLEDVDISGNTNVGALAGGLGGTVTKVYSTGSVYGHNRRVGGLVGVHAEDDSFPNSSPLVYSWNGEKYTYTTDVGSILPKELDGLDLAQIDAADVAPKDGKYSFRIAEEYNEVVYYDELALMTFDHAPGYTVAEPLDRAADDTDLRTVSDTPTNPLVSCTDEDGNDCLGALKAYDDQWSYTNTDGQYSKENLQKSWILDFGDLSGASDIQLVLRGARDYAASAEYPGNSARSVQVKDVEGNWVEVYSKEQLGSDGAPRLRTIDLTGKFLSDDHHVKVAFDTFNANYFAVDTSPQVPVTAHTYAPESVDLGFHGFTAIDRTHYFDHDYYDVSPLPVDRFKNQYGNFTKYGDVTPLLTETDDRFAVMRYGDQLSVEFPYEAPAPGMVRSFVLYNEAYYKHATNDGLGEMGQSAAYLPYEGMTSYGPGMAPYPATAENQAYQAEWNTRTYPGPFPDALTEHGSTIIDSYSTANVTGDYQVGGLVGYNKKQIRTSYAAGTVSGGDLTGGLVGDAEATESWIHDSYATGDVSSGGSYVGGLVGRNYGLIENTYSSGAVSVDGGNFVGGLIGTDNASGEDTGVYRSYSVSNITGAADLVGGLIGYTSNPDADYLTNGNYWYSDAAVGVDDDHPYQPTKAPSAEYFNTTHSQLPLSSWDFAETWRTNADALPTFLWENGDVEPEPEPEEEPAAEAPSSSHKSGGSVQSRVNALTQNGNTAAADALIAQYPNLFGDGSLATLMAKVAELKARLAALTGTASTVMGVRDLDLNMTGEDVRKLQQILIDANVGPAAVALKANGTTTTFGPLTQAALAEYQAKYGIMPSVGYFGIKTRTEMTSAGRAGLWW